jgi:hypothetical protein
MISTGLAVIRELRLFQYLKIRNVRVKQTASLNRVRTALTSRTIAKDGAAAATPNVKTDKTVSDALGGDKDPAASGGSLYMTSQAVKQSQEEPSEVQTSRRKVSL